MRAIVARARLLLAAHPLPCGSHQNRTGSDRSRPPTSFTSGLCLTGAGSDIVSTAEFDKASILHHDDLAAEMLRNAVLASLANPYYAQGYEDVRLQAPAQLDPDTHLVDLTVTFVQGGTLLEQAVSRTSDTRVRPPCHW